MLYNETAMKKMTLTEAIGIRIKELLKEKGWTQYQLEKRGGVPRSTANLIINGHVRSAKLETIYQIAATLGVSMAEFFDDPIFDEVTD